MALFKKNKGKKKKKTKTKGGGKSKYNIKMARKFRRTRRKQGGDQELEEFLGSGVEKAKDRANEVILTILGNFRKKVDDPTDEDGWSWQSTWGSGQSSKKLAETLIGNESWLQRNNQYFKHRGPFDGNGLRSDGGKEFLTKFIKYHKKKKKVCGTMFSPCSGGRKSKHNIKMARKFRRTRRKRGAGGTETKEKYIEKKKMMCGSIQANIAEARQEGTSLSDLQDTFQGDLDWCNANYFTEGNVKLGGRKRSRRKRRRRTKKRKSRRRKKRSRRRRRKKR